MINILQTNDNHIKYKAYQFNALNLTVRITQDILNNFGYTLIIKCREDEISGEGNFVGLEEKIDINDDTF